MGAELFDRDSGRYLPTANELRKDGVVAPSGVRTQTSAVVTESCSGVRLGRVRGGTAS